MDAKLFDGELKLMELVWRHEPVSAKELSVMAAEAIGWNKNTTYTVLKKLAAKGVIRRADPGFICTALVRREEVARAETESLIQKLYADHDVIFRIAGRILRDKIILAQRRVCLF